MGRLAQVARAATLASLVGGWTAPEAAFAGPGRKPAEKQATENKPVEPAPAPGKPAESPPALAPESGGPKVVVIEEAQAREWELLIELDLMADSVTFPHAIRCLAGEQGMEVRGYVPNTLVRDRALSTARKGSLMQVVNGMVVQPNLYYGNPGKLSVEDVQARLAKVASASGKTIKAQVGPNGQVMLSGNIGSLEDKVQISRSLRGLAGCISVRNDLTVTAHRVVQVPPVVATKPPPAELASATKAEEKVSQDKSPLTKPPQIIRDARPVQAASQMPPAPIPPAKHADYRPSAGAPASTAIVEDVGSPVVQASKSPAAAPATPTRPPQAQVPSESTPPPTTPAASGPAKSTTVQAMPSMRAQTAAKSRLKAAFGAALGDIEFKFDGKGGVKVIVAVAKNADTDRIAQAVIQMPELQHFDVSMELRVE